MWKHLEKEGSSLLHLFPFRRTIYALMYTNQGETVYSNDVRIDTRHQSDLPSWRIKKASESTTMIRRTRMTRSKIVFVFVRIIRIDEIYESGNPWNRRNRSTAKTSMFYIFFRFVQRKRRIIGCFCQKRISREDAMPIQSERLLITCAIKPQNPRRIR